MIQYMERIFIPYVQNKKGELGLPSTHPTLAIFDEFKGQTTDVILNLLERNNIYYVIVSPRGVETAGHAGLCPIFEKNVFLSMI